MHTRARTHAHSTQIQTILHFVCLLIRSSISIPLRITWTFNNEDQTVQMNRWGWREWECICVTSLQSKKLVEQKSNRRNMKRYSALVSKEKWLIYIYRLWFLGRLRAQYRRFHFQSNARDTTSTHLVSVTSQFHFCLIAIIIFLFTFFDIRFCLIKMIENENEQTMKQTNELFWHTIREETQLAHTFIVLFEIIKRSHLIEKLLLLLLAYLIEKCVFISQPEEVPLCKANLDLKSNKMSKKTLSGHNFHVTTICKHVHTAQRNYIFDKFEYSYHIVLFPLSIAIDCKLDTCGNIVTLASLLQFECAATIPCSRKTLVRMTKQYVLFDQNALLIRGNLHLSHNRQAALHMALNNVSFIICIQISMAFQLNRFMWKIVVCWPRGPRPDSFHCGDNISFWN